MERCWAGSLLCCIANLSVAVADQSLIADAAVCAEDTMQALPEYRGL